LIYLETSSEASEEEKNWGGRGSKTGRSATEEEDKDVLNHHHYLLEFQWGLCYIRIETSVKNKR
jgi:hypothetical protein